MRFRITAKHEHAIARRHEIWEGIDFSTNTKYAEAVPSFSAAAALTDIYIFADTYDVRLLRNQVMDVWREEEIDIADWEGVGLQSAVFLKAIKTLPSTSTLYRYLLKRYASGYMWHDQAMKRWIGEIWEDLPADFTLQFVSEQSNGLRKTKRPLYKDFYGWCKYHEHGPQTEIQAEFERGNCKDRVARLRGRAESDTSGE